MSDKQIQRIEYKHDDPSMIGYPYKLIVYTQDNDVYVYSWSDVGDTCLYVYDGSNMTIHTNVSVSVTTTDGETHLLTDIIKPIAPHTYTVFGAETTVWTICNELVKVYGTR